MVQYYGAVVWCSLFLDTDLQVVQGQSFAIGSNSVAFSLAFKLIWPALSYCMHCFGWLIGWLVGHVFGASWFVSGILFD